MRGIARHLDGPATAGPAHLAVIGVAQAGQNPGEVQEPAVEARVGSPAAPTRAASRSYAPPGPPGVPAYAATGMRSSTATGLVVGAVAFVLAAAVAGAFVFLVHPFFQTASATPIVTTGNGTPAGPVATACPASASGDCLTPNGTPGGVGASKVKLTFADAVIGQMAVTTVVNCGAGPSVAGGRQYHLSVLGTLNGQQYGFAFVIYPYTSPNTYTGAISSFFGPAGANSSLTQWRSNNTTGESVRVNSDARSGTLDLSLTGASDHSTVHVVGSWTCA